MWTQIIGIFWDVLELHVSQSLELHEKREDYKYWQSMAEQLQAINNVHENAITAKSSFLGGLAYEMKSIVHGSMYSVITKLFVLLFYLFLLLILVYLNSEHGHEYAKRHRHPTQPRDIHC